VPSLFSTNMGETGK